MGSPIPDPQQVYKVLLGRTDVKLGDDKINDILRFARGNTGRPAIEIALRIRAVETVLLELFGRGKLHGTVHTCVGQELTGALLAHKLQPLDFITSNHRCHGHFIGATGNWRGLIDEVVGNADGVCAGIGSSQHLYAENFISNGQQGGLLPVAAGLALDRSRRGTNSAIVSFMGEGTLGEGVLYETLNFASLHALPHLIVCENNFYSQSTPQTTSVSGEIGLRAQAFNVRTANANTWDPAGLDEALADAVAYVRQGRPMLLVVKTYRLNPHSKGDDQRPLEEIEGFKAIDPLNIITRELPEFAGRFDDMMTEVRAYGELALTKPGLDGKLYFVDQLPAFESTDWRACETADAGARVNQQLNAFYAERMTADPSSYFIGEDIGDPYGGAFKVSMGLQRAHPDRVISTPISEAAIAGVGVGLALAKNRPVIEIMFGDFLPLAADQIINNASKFFHMYNQNVSCPVVLRTPMGGRRGYGPTHSQSLERLFIGIDNCLAISLNSIIDVRRQLSALPDMQCPAIVFENKIDYTFRTFRPEPPFVVETQDNPFPSIRVRPLGQSADVTLVSYGGMARFVADQLIRIFEETDSVPELIVPVSLHPLHIDPILESCRQTGRLVVIEEGSGFASVGAEIIALLAGRMDRMPRTARVSGFAVPVPSPPALEAQALPSIPAIIAAVNSLRQE